MDLLSSLTKKFAFRLEIPEVIFSTNKVFEDKVQHGSRGPERAAYKPLDRQNSIIKVWGRQITQFPSFVRFSKSQVFPTVLLSHNSE